MNLTNPVILDGDDAIPLPSKPEAAGRHLVVLPQALGHLDFISEHMHGALIHRFGPDPLYLIPFDNPKLIDFISVQYYPYEEGFLRRSKDTPNQRNLWTAWRSYGNTALKRYHNGKWLPSQCDSKP